MNYKRAFITILTFIIAIQFFPRETTPSLPKNTVKLPPTELATPLVEYETKEYYFKPPIGTSWSYQAGQCVWGVSRWTGVPAGLGNANQWDDRASKLGYTVTKTPAIGSVGVVDDGYYGHVELIVDRTDTMVKSRGMNVRGAFSVVESWKPNSYFDWYIYF